jgi:hypothetical protein
MQSTFSMDFEVAATTGWKVKKRKNGFTVYSREKEDSDIAGIKAEGIIDAPIETVLAILRTVEGSEKWTPSVARKVTIRNISDLEAVTYTLNTMSWPVWDREFIIHNILRLDYEKKLLFVMSKSVHEQYPNFPKAKKSIMAQMDYSNIGFRPVGKDKCYVELTAFVDVKGDIPAWMLNFFQIKWPFKFFKSIEKQSKLVKPKLLPGIAKLVKELRELMEKDKTK